MAILKVGSVALPSPVSLSSNDEIIWSSNTGRTASGDMVGDIVAEKKNLEIKWGVLTEKEMKTISSNLKAGFFPMTFRDDGVEITIKSYRGTNELSAGTTYSYTYSSESPNVSFYKQEDGSFTVVNEVIQIQPPFDRKYLIKDSETGYLYNITDRALVRIPISEVTATVFRQYGMDEISDPALLFGISKPTILYWQDSDTKLPEKKVTITATPPEQNILTNIDLSDESIKGITGVNVEASGAPVFSCSFDDGSTWSIHNGTDWVALADGASGMDADALKAITSEQWNAATAGGSFFVFRITLTSAEDAVSSVVFNFMN